jgi:hypothetical protein
MAKACFPLMRLPLKAYNLLGKRISRYQDPVNPALINIKNML